MEETPMAVRRKEPLMSMPDLQSLGGWFSGEHPSERFRQTLAKLSRRTPVPVFWLLGKTQSGKTSLIRFLTGASDAEIGEGFKPCTRYSRRFAFPSPEAPLLHFLDTRGIDEPGYTPDEDLAAFKKEAHVLLVTAKVLDHAQENIVKHLERIQRAGDRKPALLLLTCLHEAYPQEQHPEPYPFEEPIRADPAGWIRSSPNQPEGDGQRAASRSHADLWRSMSEQEKRFRGNVDEIIPVDLTRPVEGFKDSNYGGDFLKERLLGMLPVAYRQSLIQLEGARKELKDLYAQRALPYIVGYSSLAATAGAVPIPWVDLLILPAIQTRMIYHLAKLYGQPLSATRFLELAGTLGLGLLVRQAVREVFKVIPYVGSVASGTLAAASTFALGKAFCYYYSAVHDGHVPTAHDLRHYYAGELKAAEGFLRVRKNKA